MRELTWNEKIIDAKSNLAISKWCDAIEDAINAIANYEGDKDWEWVEVTIQNFPEENIDFTYEIYEDIEETSKSLYVKLTRKLPELSDEAFFIVEEIAESEGADMCEAEDDDDKLMLGFII